MSSPPIDRSSLPNATRAGRYPATQWSLVIAAGEGDEKALNALFRSYWFPVYGAFFDKVKNHHDAEDLAQRLFSDIHRRRDLEKIDSDKGRFRSFLKAAVGNMHRNYVTERTAKKRGGKQNPISIDGEKAEDWMQKEPLEDQDPSVLFDRRWIFAIMENAKNNLRRTHIEQGKLSQFEALEEVLLPQNHSVSYSEIASRLNQKEGTARVAAYRIRERFREQIRSCILETVGNPAEARDELAYLSALIGVNFAGTAKE